MSINKNGIIIGTPIEGFSKASINKGTVVTEYSNIANWVNGHWWGVSESAQHKRFVPTLSPGNYLLLVRDEFDLVTFCNHQNPIVLIAYNSSTGEGDTHTYAVCNKTAKFTLNLDFKIYIQQDIDFIKLQTILSNTYLYKLDNGKVNPIQANNFYEI